MIKNLEKIHTACFKDGAETDNVFVCKWFSDLIDVQCIARDIEERETFSNDQYVSLFNLNSEMQVLNEKILEIPNIVDGIKEPVDRTTEIIGFYIKKIQETGYDPYHEKKGKSADLSFLLNLSYELGRYL